jgi:DNA-binding CsgD family transcriptional regulator
MEGEVNLMTRARLSSIELTTLKAIANGLSSKEIAAIVSRSIGAVEANIRTLFVKLDAQSRAHLVARAFCLRVIASEDIAAAEAPYLQHETFPNGESQRGEGVATMRTSRKFDRL